MKKNTTPVYSIPADQAWAAAWTAWRLNSNQYLKLNRDGLIANKIMMTGILLNQPELITDQDREQSRVARDRLGIDVNLRVLKGEELNEWTKLQANICLLETFTSAYDLAVLASYPKSYSKLKNNDLVEDRLSACQDHPVGTGRVQLTVESIKCIYSQKHNCWFVWAIDLDTNCAVMFSYREEIAPGARFTLLGRVRFYQDRTTRLNRVTVLEQHQLVA
jgi:hypothetical protein